jgi:FG-GAP-like repeat
MRLGDINGDGRMELVVGQPVDQATLDSYTPQRVAAITAFDLKGNQLWQVGTPNAFHSASSDIPLQVYDMDGDGSAEVFANMSNTQMSVFDGATGALQRTIPLPAAGANDSIAFANLRGTAWPQDIIVKTRYSQFWAITGVPSANGPAGTVLWTHAKGPATGFSDLSTGHYPLAYDWSGDGRDEVMGGYDFMDSNGNTLWSSTTLNLHADAIATGDMDGNAANGKEIIICGDVAAAYDWRTGNRIWQDTRTTEVQQIGMGDYRPDLPGLEVVLLDRLRTAALGLKSNNLLVDRQNNLLWRENRPNDSGWLTVTENLNNWDGKGSDHIFSYRRGAGGAFLYDGFGNTIAAFPYPGSSPENFAQHADLCGDAREEVILYDDSTAWIYANGGCDLDAPPIAPGIPQQYHLYNWSIYSGWVTPDVKFFTPGSSP